MTEWSPQEKAVTVYFRGFHQAYDKTIVDILKLKGFDSRPRSPEEVRDRLDQLCHTEPYIKEHNIYDETLVRWSCKGINNLIRRYVPLFCDARYLLVVDDKVVEAFSQVVRKK